MPESALWETMRGTALLLLGAGAASLLPDLVRALPKRAGRSPLVGPTRAVRGLVPRVGSLVGFTLSITPPAASRPTPPPGREHRQAPESARPETGGSLPPRPPVRAGCPSVHPAIHGHRRGSARPLFPRAGGRFGRDRVGGPGARRRGSEGLFVYPPLRTRPGYDVGGREACSRARHTVRPGESLWSIAGDALATDEGRRIAFYWPRIYRANRRIVGSNPDLIYPGQQLRLPPECGR